MRASAAVEQAAADLPKVGDLDLRGRALYHGSVAFDLALRTALSAILTGAMAPTALSRAGRTELDRLSFYADLAEASDAGAVFEPPGEIDVEVETGEVPEGTDNCRVDVLRFESPYVALNPEVREEYRRHENNGFARAQHWRHSSGPRQTLCVIHGFGASPAWFNSAFFSLREFFADGWDILLYTIPFHGSRRGQRAVMNGVELFAGGFSQMNEGLIQAVHDFRAFCDYLERAGVPRFGVTGLSLGGYLSATLAAVEDRLDFAIPNAPVTWIPGLLRSWFPASLGLGILRLVKGIDADAIERSLAVHSPLNYEPVIPKDRLMIVGGMGDRLAPPEQSQLLWEHWGRPRIEWFPGSHIIHLARDGYLDAMRELMVSRPASAMSPDRNS